MTRRPLLSLGIAAILLLVAILSTTAARQSTSRPVDDEIPTALAKRGDIELKVHANGELRASHSMTLSAPPLGGDSLRITSLIHTGASIKKGDVVIEFDPTEQRYKLEQSHSELQEAQQDIIKAKADAAVQAAKDKVDLLKARYAVRRAELDVQKKELVSTIDAEKNQLALEQAKRSLAELEQNIKSHGTTGQTGIDLAREKWNKAKISMDQAQQNITKMRVVSPMNGLVAIQKNESGDVMFFGQNLPDYRIGDQVQSGAAIAQVIDLVGMEITAKVGELQRGNVDNGQPVEVQFDAMPGKIFHGTVKSASGMVQRQIWDMGSAASSYDVSIQLAGADSRLRPGLTAQVIIIGGKKSNLIYIPRQALFQKDGKQVVFLKTNSGFEQRSISILTSNESRIAVNGIKEGSEVALIDPTGPRKTSTSSSLTEIGGTTP